MSVNWNGGELETPPQEPPISREEIAELLAENARLRKELKIEADKLKEAFGL